MLHYFILFSIWIGILCNDKWGYVFLCVASVWGYAFFIIPRKGEKEHEEKKNRN